MKAFGDYQCPASEVEDEPVHSRLIDYNQLAYPN